VLELGSVRPRLGSKVNKGFSAAEIAVVVGSDVGNEIRRMVRPNRASGYLYAGHI
jgi:hypothetical protein